MVQLSTVPKDTEVAAPVVEGLKSIDLGGPGQDALCTAVYGSSYASQDLPQHEMPEKEMPKEVAYRMIRSLTVPNA